MSVAQYLPSYFEIFIDTDQNLESLIELPPTIQGLYYHEYFHYLQDLTTTYGLCKTWNVYDRLRQVVSFLQKENGKIDLPLKNVVVDEQKNYFRFINVQGGNKALPTPLHWLVDKYVISEINLVSNDHVEKIIPNAKLVEVTFSLKDYPEIKYSFGEIAITESMTYLIEKKFYTLDPAPRFPYSIAEEIIRFLNLKEFERPEIIFGLCDVALMHPMPGWAFYTILEEAAKQFFNPKTPKEIYDFGIQVFYKLGWKVYEQMEDAANGIATIVDEMYNHDYFKTTRNWFKLIVVRGYQLRCKNPYLLINLFEGEQAFGEELMEIWHNLGGPHCINNKVERSMKVPAGLNEADAEIHPIHLKIARQFNNFFLNGTVSCALLDMCNNSVNKKLVDERCNNNPWKRANDDFACPFAASWNLYGFKEENFRLNGEELSSVN